MMRALVFAFFLLFAPGLAPANAQFAVGEHQPRPIFTPIAIADCITG